VLQLFNLSRRLDVKLRNCWSFGVVGATHEQSQPLPQEEVENMLTTDKLLDDMQNMDFRPNPAETELQQEAQRMI
jgi:hypothetical protein